MSFGVHLFVGVLSIQRKSSMDKDSSGRIIFSGTFQSWAGKIFHHSAKKMRKLNRNCIQRAQKKNLRKFLLRRFFFRNFHWNWGNIFRVLVEKSFSVALSKVPDSFSEKNFEDDFLWQSSISFETLLHFDQKNIVLGKIVFARLSKLPSRCSELMLRRNFLRRFGSFKKILEVERNYNGQFPKTFWLGSRNGFLCVQRNKMNNEIYLKKTFFSFFFLISTGDFLKFCPKSIGRFLKTPFIKSGRIFLTKILWDHLFFWVDFGLWVKQSWVFGWKLLTCLSKMHSYCSKF